jgi:hypothetical protein
MNMPGFSGEVPLNRGRGRQHSGAMQGGLARVQGVVPQLPKSIGFCMDDCDERYEWGTVDNAYCKARCFDDGGDQGGGGGTGGGTGGGGLPQEHVRQMHYCRTSQGYEVLRDSGRRLIFHELLIALGYSLAMLGRPE